MVERKLYSACAEYNNLILIYDANSKPIQSCSYSQKAKPRYNRQNIDRCI